MYICSVKRKIRKKEMYQTEGYWNVKPRIKRLSFPKRGKFQVDLFDGRSIMMPVSAFPSLKRVPVKERDKWYLTGGGVTWDSCPEVIHIEQILGNFQNYANKVGTTVVEQRQKPHITPEDLEITPFVSSIGESIKPLSVDFDYDKAKQEYLLQKYG